MDATRYAGVHLCSPEEQEVATVRAQEIADSLDGTVSPVGSPGADGTPDGTGPPSRLGEGEGPFFKQNSPTWGADEYDHGMRQDVGCGETIAQCGCAMTSVATVLSLFNVVATGEGEELNPQTLNDWFNAMARNTNSGWVSRGYSYGNVDWLAANAFSAEVASQRAGSPVVSYRSWGQGTPEEVRSELQAGRFVVLEVPGHFIAAVGLDGEPPTDGPDNGQDIIINDPFFADRITLASYDGLVRSSRLFNVDRIEDADLSAISISVPSNLRVRVSIGGKTTGTLDDGNASEIAGGASEEIPGSTYQYEAAWRDPTCTERAPPPDTGTNTIVITRPADNLPLDEVITIEVVNPDGGETTVAIRSVSEDGEMVMESRDATEDETIVLEYDPEFGTFTPSGKQVDDSGTPIPTGSATPTLEPGATQATPSGNGVIVTASPGDTQQPTDTPVPPIVSPTLSIGSTSANVGSQVSVELRASMPPPGLGSWTIDIQYNPGVVSPDDCFAGGGGVCVKNFDRNLVRVTGASAGGLDGTFSLAGIRFNCTNAGTSTLSIIISVFADGTIGNPRDVVPSVDDGSITCR